jgi:hypothetical protein
MSPLELAVCQVRERESVARLAGEQGLQSNDRLIQPPIALQGEGARERIISHKRSVGTLKRYTVTGADRG